MYIPSSSLFHLSLPLYYVLCISLDRITIVSSYLFVPISLRCTMVSTRRRNLWLFPFFLLSFIIFFYLFLSFFLYFFYIFFYILFFHNESPRLWWRDAIRIRVWLSVLCSCSQQNCDIFWDNSWLPVARFFFFFFWCLNMSQVRSTLLDQICFSFDSWDYAQISNNQTYRSLHGDGQ